MKKKKRDDKDDIWRSFANVFKDQGNYSYATARVKAKRSKLIPADAYPKLMLMDMPQITQFMMDAGYRREVDELSGKYTGADLVEYALNRNLATSFQGVLKMTTGMLHESIGRYLARWDVNNIKTVLRGNLWNAPPSEIMESVVPAGAFDEEFFAALAQKESVEETLEGLDGTPFHEALMEAYPEYRESRKLAVLETALEKSYYDALLESLGTGREADELLSRFIRSRIDLGNMETLFRMKYRGMDAQQVRPYMLEGGEQTHGRMLREAMEATDMDGLLDACRRLSFYAAIKDAAIKAGAQGSLNPVAHELESIFLRISRDFSYRYPLSILPILDYMIRKENEVRNLRAIARGKEHGIEKTEIESMLLLK